MAISRMQLVDESCSSLYHCVCRTVRQAFLLAPQSDGVVDNHRRDRVLERVRLQAEVWKAVLDEFAEDADSPNEARTGEKLDAFIASFAEVKFHPAVPARRVPLHPRGVAADDEPIDAVRVLGTPVQPAATPVAGATEVDAKRMVAGPADGVEVGPVEEQVTGHEPDAAGQGSSPGKASRTAGLPLPPP